MRKPLMESFTMDDKSFAEIETIINTLLQLTEGFDHVVVESAISIYLGDLVCKYQKTDEEVRSLYRMFADAAILTSQMKNDYDQLQATEDSTQEEDAETARQKARNVPGPFGVN